MRRFLLCFFGALACSVGAVIVCVLTIPNERASFVAACLLLIAIAIVWGRLAAQIGGRA
ncbi:MAG TPA: hypothetical protein VKB47_08600 [Terracidiphilus sp.]|nr:hypothetical protein [Terracidiphilus sp.]